MTFSLVGSLVILIVGLAGIILGSHKLIPRIEKNIDKARKERSAQMAKVIVEGLSQMGKEFPEGELPDQFKQLLEQFYAETFWKAENLPDTVSKHERTRYKLIYSQVCMVVSIAVSGVTLVLSYIGIEEIILPGFIIALALLILSISLYIYITWQVYRT